MPPGEHIRGHLGIGVPNVRRIVHIEDGGGDEVRIFGKQIITKRKVAWYGSKPFLYRYSNTSKTAIPFTDELLAIKSVIEKVSSETYNSCLLNLYHFNVLKWYGCRCIGRWLYF